MSWLCPLVALFCCALAWMSRHLVALIKAAVKNVVGFVGFDGRVSLPMSVCSFVWMS